ncbi:MAG: sulfur carrier protein ThiS [Armatimonadota bacterium]|nr:sulfur carrier protein ThiS [Armatimonadota bacterium]
MRVYVNGKETEVAEQLTVAALLAEKGLNPDTVVVEHNLVILPKEKWSRLALAAEDQVEIVTFMGGG